jgi:hypothetical protein
MYILYWQMFRKLAVGCIILAILMTGLGGYLDMRRRRQIWGITKKHMWNDGHFLVLLAIAFLLMERAT